MSSVISYSYKIGLGLNFGIGLSDEENEIYNKIYIACDELGLFAAKNDLTEIIGAEWYQTILLKDKVAFCKVMHLMMDFDLFKFGKVVIEHLKDPIRFNFYPATLSMKHITEKVQQSKL